MDYAKKAEDIRRELSRAWMLAAYGHANLANCAKTRGQGITAMIEALNGTFCAIRAMEVGKRPFKYPKFKQGGIHSAHIGRTGESIITKRATTQPWND